MVFFTAEKGGEGVFGEGSLPQRKEVRELSQRVFFCVLSFLGKYVASKKIKRGTVKHFDVLPSNGLLQKAGCK